MFDFVKGYHLGLIGFLIFPAVGILDFSFFSLVLLFFVALIRTNFNPKGFKLHHDSFVICLGFSVLWFFTITTFFLNGATSIDAQFMFKPPRVVLIVLLLSYILISYKITSTEVMLIIYYAASINAIVIFLQYILHFLGITDSFLLNPNTGDNALTPYRKPGLMAGFPIAGLFSLIGALCAIYLYSLKKNIWFLLGAIGIGVTCFLTSRTSMYLFILLFVPYFFYICRVVNNKVAPIGFILIILSSVFFLTTSDNPIVRGTVNKMFANVNNYISSGSAMDYSTQDLVDNHYQFPNDEKVLLLGTSLPNYLSPVNTDVSIYRITWYSGIITTILYVLLFVSVFISSCFQCGRSKLILCICIFIGLSIANMKGSYLFSRVLGDCYLLFWLALLNDKRRRT